MNVQPSTAFRSQAIALAILAPAKPAARRSSSRRRLAAATPVAETASDAKPTRKRRPMTAEEKEGGFRADDSLLGRAQKESREVARRGCDEYVPVRGRCILLTADLPRSFPPRARFPRGLVARAVGGRAVRPRRAPWETRRPPPKSRPPPVFWDSRGGGAGPHPPPGRGRSGRSGAVLAALSSATAARRVRIPTKSITHSDRNRSPVPTETDHLSERATRDLES